MPGLQGSHTDPGVTEGLNPDGVRFPRGNPGIAALF